MTNFTVSTVPDGLAPNNAKPSADSYNFEYVHVGLCGQPMGDCVTL